MKRRKINLGMGNKKTGETWKRPIKTTIVNEVFAVHGTIQEDDKIDRSGFTLTHIPTGWAVVQNRNSKDQLIRAAKNLLMLGDWKFTDPADATELFEPSEVMAIVNAY